MTVFIKDREVTFFGDPVTKETSLQMQGWFAMHAVSSHYSQAQHPT